MSKKKRIKKLKDLLLFNQQLSLNQIHRLYQQEDEIKLLKQEIATLKAENDELRVKLTPDLHLEGTKQRTIEHYLERMATLSQDNEKQMAYENASGKWYWWDTDEEEALPLTERQGPFDTFFKCLYAATQPYMDDLDGIPYVEQEA